MDQIERRIKGLTKLGDWLREFCGKHPIGDEELAVKLHTQQIHNPWLIEPFGVKALNLWAKRLAPESLYSYVSKFSRLQDKRQEKHVAVIPEEIIPLAGMHDLIAVLLAGHHFYCRNVNHEHDLLQFLTDKLISFEPELKEFIHWGAFSKKVDTYLLHSKPGNDTAFLSYFEQKHSLIRQKRISIGIVSDTDGTNDFKRFGSDIFTFFGLGNFSVRKIFVPRNFSLPLFFEAIEEYSWLYQYNRYANNYDYHKSVFMMDLIPFYDNGFLVLRESSELHVPLGCLYYEYYDTKEDIQKRLDSIESGIQQVVTNVSAFPNAIKPGMAHEYQLWDYADHQDSLQFLLE